MTITLNGGGATLSLLQYTKDNYLTLTDYNSATEVYFYKHKDVYTQPITDGKVLIPNQLLYGDFAGSCKFEVRKSSTVIYTGNLIIESQPTPDNFEFTDTEAKDVCIVDVPSIGSEGTVVELAGIRLLLNYNMTSSTFNASEIVKGISFSKHFDSSKISSLQLGFSNLNGVETIDLSNFDSSNLSASIFGLFQNDYKLENVNLKNFDTKNVTNMGQLFYNCYALKTVDLSFLNTSKVASFDNMFRYCRSLETLDFSNFDTSNAVSMSYMFNCTNNLKHLDCSNFNTEKVTNFGGTFRDCLAETINVSSFNTSKVTTFAYTFCGCIKITSLDLHSFTGDNVTSLAYMFYNCNILESLDLSTFNTPKVTSMDAMFTKCSKLESLTLGPDWGVNASIKTFDLSACPLTHDSCLDVFNKLADKTKTATTSATLKLKSTTKALMSEAEIKIATVKGWTVS